MPDPRLPPVSVVGLIGGECFGASARAAIAGADVIVGSKRQLELLARSILASQERNYSGSATPESEKAGEQLVLDGALDVILDVVEQRRSAGLAVCVLASGDPGFFGIARVLGARFGRGALAVHPAPSSIALAFARIGCSWDDAVVVSAHGRPLDEAVTRLVPSAKAAVLASPDNPPEVIAGALVARGLGGRAAAVVTRIGEPREAVVEADLCTVAAGTYDPMSVLVVHPDGGGPSAKGLAWGLPEREFAHRAGMITKAEVRAVVLGKLDLPAAGVLWDVGAGSGSVAIEAARLCPGLRVLAIESDAESAARIDANARTHAVGIEVVRGSAPGALEPLPEPDRAFVGGGGIEVLDAVLARLRPGGVAVANYALVDRAVLGWQRLGNLVELSVARGEAVGDHGVRLAAQNPVFVCWGPS